MNLVGKELDKVSIKMEKTELASRAAGRIPTRNFSRMDCKRLIVVTNIVP